MSTLLGRHAGPIPISYFPLAVIPELPASFQDLYKSSGPVLRYRILRDVLGRDESWIETSNAQSAVQKHPRVVELAAQQLENGSFGDRLSSTAASVLWFCEAGAESHSSVKRALDFVVLPTLAQEDAVWEFLPEQRALVRDICLHLLARATRGKHELLEAYLELVKLEWQHWFSDKKFAPPTAPAYAAMVWWQAPPNIALDKRTLLAQLLNEAEACPVRLLPDNTLLTVPDKEIYLTEPVRMFYDLEHGARAGVVADVAHLKWLYEELEVQQDADGLWYFDTEDTPAHLSWYYPMEKDSDPRELTVRALMIYKLLNYDV